MNGSKAEPLREVISAEQIQKRGKELGRQISDDYKGQTIQALAVLENSFLFLADLVRALDGPVVCQFIKPKYTPAQKDSPSDIMEIFFSHEPDIRGQNLLLVEGLVHSGVTSEFLDERPAIARRSLGKAGHAIGSSVSTPCGLAAGLFGFLVDETFLTGYGFGAVEQTNRNLPYLGAG